MSVKERFKNIRERLGVNQSDFGISLGTNQAGVTDIERGKKNLSVDIMEILHNKYSINLNWLICGTGRMKREEQESSNERESSPSYGDKEMMQMLIEAQKKTIETLEKRNKELEEKNR